MSAAVRLKDTNTLIDPSIEIRVWMTRVKIRPIDIARELGINPSAVTRFIDGNRRSMSRRIWELLVDKGCPEELLMALWGVGKGGGAQ